MERKVYKLDATNQTVGRLSTQIATILRGKHKPEFQPHMDLGDIVEVENVSKLKFTGKEYYSYSGYPGGLKTKKMQDIMEKNPGEVLKRAVRKMIPNIKLRNDMLKRLIIK